MTTNQDATEPDTAIEAAAVAMFYGQNGITPPYPLWEGAGSDENDSYRDLANLALSAAAPIIAAQAKADALRETAEYLDTPGVVWHGDGGVSIDVGDKFLRRPKLTDWLRARAATIEGATP